MVALMSWKTSICCLHPIGPVWALLFTGLCMTVVQGRRVQGGTGGQGGVVCKHGVQAGCQVRIDIRIEYLQ